MSPHSPQPFLHTTPPEALGKLIHKSVPVGNRCFDIDYPGDADKLLDHPSTHEAFKADDYMPYWAELWPSAQMLGEALLAAANDADWPVPAQPTDPIHRTALEIGCGVGLSGIVALSMGLHVIFSDYDATAVEFAARNAQRNGFDDFETLPLDWRVPPDFQVPLILAADVIYEERNIEPLIALIKVVLAPSGVCVLSDPDRSTRGGFRYALKQAGCKVTQTKMTAPGPGGREVTGTVYFIRW
ncbi:MAG: methyltransferase domain-containing protein [Cyanobacteria bacterium P01_F01_bin.53]